MPALPSCHLILRAKKPLPPAYPREVKTLGDRLRKRRLDLGLLQREVAERLGVSAATVYAWEGNLTEPRISHLPRIAAFLGDSPAPIHSGS